MMANGLGRSGMCNGTCISLCQDKCNPFQQVILTTHLGYRAQAMADSSWFLALLRLWVGSSQLRPDVNCEILAGRPWVVRYPSDTPFLCMLRSNPQGARFYSSFACMKNLECTRESFLIHVMAVAEGFQFAS